MTKSLYAVELSKEAYAELVFWNQNVDSINHRSPCLPVLPCILAKFVYSDASDDACGSFIPN